MAWTAGCAGMAEPLPTLSVAPATLSVSTKVGSSNTVPVSVINTGTTPVTVSQVVVNGTGFSVTGTTAPMTLATNQTTSFNVKFTPTDTGSVSGSVKVHDRCGAPSGDVAAQRIGVEHDAAGEHGAGLASGLDAQPGGTIKFAALIQGATANDFGYVVHDDRHDHDRRACLRRR